MAKIKIKDFVESFIYEETKEMIKQRIAELKERDLLTSACFPFLRDMGDHYDTYQETKEYFKSNPRTTVNKKGEEVTHPMSRVQEKAYAQYLVLSKEFGFTLKSAAQISSHPASNKGEDDSAPITKWK